VCGIVVLYLASVWHCSTISKVALWSDIYCSVTYTFLIAVLHSEERLHFRRALARWSC